MVGTALGAGIGAVLWKHFTGPGVIFIPLGLFLIAAGGLVEVVTGIGILHIVRRWKEFEKTPLAQRLKFALVAIVLMVLFIYFKSLPKT